MTAFASQPPTPRRRLPGLLIGLGLGGLADGIFLHQILQWHHMLTAEGCCSATTVDGLERNTLADGLFHAVAWLALVGGIGLAARHRSRGETPAAARCQVGLWAVGWGTFNLVEGMVDHHVLGLHHVRDDVTDPLPYDLAFLGFGALLVLVGLALIRAQRARAA